MMRWLRLALCCWLLLCAILGLTLPVDQNHPLQVVDSGPWLVPARECAADGPTALVVRSMELDLVHARSLISVVLDYRWTPDNLAPPGRRPWAARINRAAPSCRSSRQLQPTLSSSLFSTKNTGLTRLNQPILKIRI